MNSKLFTIPLLESLLEERFLSRVTFAPHDSLCTLPVFEASTGTVGSVWGEFIRKYQLGIPYSDGDFYLELQNQARVGALAAQQADACGTLYEVGGGVGIPALTYTLLTGKPATVVDPHPSSLVDVHFFSEFFEAKNLRAAPLEAEEFFSATSLTSEDTVLFNNPETDVLRGFLEHYTPKRIIINGMGRVFMPDPSLDERVDDTDVYLEIDYGEFGRRFKDKGYLPPRVVGKDKLNYRTYYTTAFSLAEKE